MQMNTKNDNAQTQVEGSQAPLSHSFSTSSGEGANENPAFLKA